MKFGKTLVAYFSPSGYTAEYAQEIAADCNGTLFEIKPAKLYTDEDLDWTNKNSRSTKEMRDPKARPELNETCRGAADGYDIIYLGYPIWWDEAPRIINSFIEANNLKGKVINPFATSGGSDITNSVEKLRKTYPELMFETGHLLNDVSQESVANWVLDSD